MQSLAQILSSSYGYMTAFTLVTLLKCKIIILFLLIFLDKEIETRLVPLPKNTELQSLQNSLCKEFLGSFYINSPVIKATYESFKTFPDVLLKKLVELLNNWGYLESNEAYSGYPYIYNLKNLETGFTLPFVDFSQEDYNLVALYQCE